VIFLSSDADLSLGKKKTVTVRADELWDSLWTDSAAEGTPAAAAPFEYDPAVVDNSDSAQRSPSFDVLENFDASGSVLSTLFSVSSRRHRRADLYSLTMKLFRQWQAPAYRTATLAPL